MALGGIQTTELIVSNTKIGEKIKIKGLTDALRDNDEFLDLVELLELSYANFTHVRPEIRLLYTLMSSGMKVHAVNSFMEKRKQMLKPDEDEEEEQLDKPDNEADKPDKSDKCDNEADKEADLEKKLTLDFD